MTRTLLIDNYDSYTYNLFQYLAEVNGCEPQVILNDQYSSWADLMKVFDGKIDNIVLSPGPGTPSKREDFGISYEAIKYSDIPLLGVCLGHQGIAHVFGGKVVRASIPMHGRLSSLKHLNTDIFKDIPQDFRVVRYHSLIAEAASFPEDLVATAWTEDGTIMGLRHQSKPIFGVQFHPESISTEYGRQILRNFRRISDGSVKRARLARPVSHSQLIAMKPFRGEKYHRHVHIIDMKYDSTSFPLDELFRRLYAGHSARFFFDSSSTMKYGQSEGTFSLLGAVDTQEGFSVEYLGNNTIRKWYCGSNESEYLRQDIFDFIEERAVREKCTRTTFSSPSPLPGNLTETMFGYLGYELRDLASHRRDGTATWEENRHVREGRVKQPLALFMCPTRFLLFDHDESILRIVSIKPESDAARAEGEGLHGRVLEAMNEMTRSPSVIDETMMASTTLIADRSIEEYTSAIQSSLDYIRAGETYEICLTLEFQGKLPRASDSDDHYTIYQRLRRGNPAPYSSFMHYDNSNSPGFSILCSSPERFLKASSEGVLETKPIKGTSRRDLQDPSNDAMIAKSLGEDEKSLAENLMIVDLVRNDLGRVCEIGTVHAPQLMKVETYASVHQLVSTVRGQLRSDCSIADSLIALFPGGSMTGAPKLRTMNIIDSLENRPRGIYSGAIGYISSSGSADLNIVIRTAVISEDVMTVGSGGAIIALSEPEKEVDEVVLKAQAVSRSLGCTIAFPPNQVKRKD